MPAVLGVSLDQGQKVLVKAEGKTVYLPCKVTDLQNWNYIHWYQMKDGEAPSRQLYISQRGDVTRDTSEANDFTVDKTMLYDLKLSNTQENHAAVYFCAYWDTSSDKKVFGSGTRLYVTDKAIKAPTLSRYLPSEKDKSDKHGKKTLLIQASDMFPDLVKFVWKRKDGEKWTDVSEGEVLEQRNGSPAVTVTSMLIVDKDKAKNDYQCTVTHEGNTAGTKTLEMKEENSKPTKGPTDGDQNSVTCPPSTEEPITNQISGDSEQIPSMFLFVYAYAVLLMKNGLFFSVVSIFLLKRKVGRKDKSSKT
ncbi:immunoglobulin lambda-1 light chain-like isoform X4 [Onychostoma macrolepis]|uniref:immunoglobulin lambda-1 light chain-like isoform X4 n=1 Tax=Onychostoma macrolepis TaxID=369639 RepID=UPI00272D80AE|nr:immunoglobulin lambda-1 light chain-like isoform X4 [Onychostoma macrolepis]